MNTKLKCLQLLSKHTEEKLLKTWDTLYLELLIEIYTQIDELQKELQGAS